MIVGQPLLQYFGIVDLRHIVFIVFALHHIVIGYTEFGQGPEGWHEISISNEIIILQLLEVSEHSLPFYIFERIKRRRNNGREAANREWTL